MTIKRATVVAVERGRVHVRDADEHLNICAFVGAIPGVGEEVAVLDEIVLGTISY